ncbi:MAG: pyridine nucleotide-disulfide oxidoreductase/dicluster-binding protein [Chloroflexota bacterium]
MITQSELHQLEDKCIQECAPACAAACPIHVDVRTVMAEISRGDFSAALKVLKKTLPYPGIISRICLQPCRAVCKRSKAGEAISMAALERACADWGDSTETPRRLPQRGKRVAIVGGGLSGLTAAFDLARKGYGVVIYEAGDHLGGSLWNFSEEVLPRHIIHSELSIVEQVGAAAQLNMPVHNDELAGLRREFDVVYLAIGANGEIFNLALDEQGRIQVDPVTFATNQAGVFAGGSLLRSAAERSPIQSISDGRRAAISIDRYLQKASLTAARLDEGAYTTRLYTNMQGIAPLLAVPVSNPAQGYTRQEAIQEAQRCLQCECMECVKVCEYLKHYGRYPKKYAREIFNNLSIVMGARQSNLLINSCSLCGLCGEICPTGLNMAEVNKNARQMMVAQKRMPPSAHDFALRDMQFSNSDKFVLARHRPGATRSEYVLFPGCQLAGSSPEYVEQVYGDLQDRLGDVGLMLRCCGAPADWAGRTDLFQSALADFTAQYRRLGSPQLVLACSSCYQVFKAHLPDARLISLWSLYDERGLPQAAIKNLKSKIVAVHDPCPTRYESHIQDSVRNLLRRLGYQLEELPLSRERTECCSYGGLMWLANRELAQAVVERRIAESRLDYVTYCAMCRDFFAARGKRTLHLLDLIYGQDPDGRATRPSPGHSERHENRARLKRKLLKETWGEDMDGPSTFETIRLAIADDVRARLEQRLILDEDLRRVLEFAERTGHKLLNRQTGHWLAHHRPTAVTYWVEYTQQGDTFVIHNAYSHRMQVVEDVKA